MIFVAKAYVVFPKYFITLSRDKYSYDFLAKCLVISSTWYKYSYDHALTGRDKCSYAIFYFFAECLVISSTWYKYSYHFFFCKVLTHLDNFPRHASSTLAGQNITVQVIVDFSCQGLHRFSQVLHNTLTGQVLVWFLFTLLSYLNDNALYGTGQVLVRIFFPKCLVISSTRIKFFFFCTVLPRLDKFPRHASSTLAGQNITGQVIVDFSC